MCALPGTPFGASTGPDPEPAPNFYTEADLFDNDCTLYEGQVSMKLKARELESLGLSPMWDELSDTWQGGNTTGLEERSLAPRGVADAANALKLCAGSIVLGALLEPQSYSGHNTVAKQIGGYWTTSNPNVCGALGMTLSASAVQGIQYVTEHVFEKQLFRNALQWMFSGIAPDGTNLAAGKLIYKGIFDLGGVSCCGNSRSAARLTCWRYSFSMVNGHPQLRHNCREL